MSLQTKLRWLALPGAVVAGFLLSSGGAAAPTFRNPVIDSNFPDPFILRAGHTYYAYATNGKHGNVPYAVSSNLVNWEIRGDAFAQLPAWGEPGLTWAPEVAYLGSHYVLYFTARDRASGRQCIGTAVSQSPAGPFVAAGQGPLVCQTTQGGSIDASPFRDKDGQSYLLWKNDGNCCNLPTSIYIQPLQPGGLKLMGKATALISNFALWEGSVIEAPTLHYQDGYYYLLYSGGPFDSDLYAMGYAVARKLTGPYHKAPENPILVTTGEVSGPGHQTLIADGKGQSWLAYHAWKTGFIGDQVGYRAVHLSRINFKKGKVTVQPPSLAPQVRPTALGGK